jgi:N-methylhydantoinase B/oxoprolinase/acetone carboxylase alpha subunit
LKQHSFVFAFPKHAFSYVPFGYIGRLVHHKLREDSGGPGQHRGGLGIELKYRSLEKSTVNVMLERILEPPWGIEGGQNGRSNAATLRNAASGDERPVTKESNIPLGADDTVVLGDRVQVMVPSHRVEAARALEA